MSGGSWDYQFEKVQHLGEQLLGEPDALRRRLGTHLLACAKACQAIEWSDSGDDPPDAWRGLVEDLLLTIDD